MRHVRVLGAARAAGPRAGQRGEVRAHHRASDAAEVLGAACRRVAAEESDAHWASRPEAHQVSATASPQSRVVRDAAELRELDDAVRARLAGMREAVPGAVLPRPPYWGGFRVRPHAVEFWEQVRGSALALGSGWLTQ